eukprot:scaffold22742_cov139-Cylindrotheca_fusiformis.AAC.4
MAPLIDDNLISCTSEPSFEHEPQSNFKQESKTTKSVTFSEMSDLYLIPHARDMKPKDKEATWMNKNDFRRIEKENIYTLHQMTTGTFPSSKKAYFRGLETLLPEARTKRKQRITFVVRTILREQKNSRNLSPRWLEEFSYTFTSKSAEAAYRKGVWDAAEAGRSDESLLNKTQVWI